MNITPAHFPLQRTVRALPGSLRRIKIARFIAFLTGLPYHRIDFQQGALIGNVRDNEVANCLVKGTFVDYGYFNLARSLLAAGDVHVDVGANYGFHTFGLLQFPAAASVQYILIDANPDCVACLRESAKLHPGFRLDIHHAAVAERAGRLRFAFAPSVTGGGHVGLSDHPGKNEIEVPAMPLDPLFREKGIQWIGLMKMDIEGSELRGLKSMPEMLHSHRVNFIYFEVNPACLERQGEDPAGLFKELMLHGYRLFWPHDDAEWILQTYGRRNATEAGLRRFTIMANEPRAVIEFDPLCYKAGEFGQCDLLAVSPTCRVEAGAV